MLINFLGAIWRHLPGSVRRRLSRLGQSRFTVTTAAFIFDGDGRLLLLEHVFRPDNRLVRPTSVLRLLSFGT